MKNYIVSLLCAALFALSTAVNAQVVGGAGGGGVAVTNCVPNFPIPDLTATSNHASLVAYNLKRVQGINAYAYAGSDANNSHKFPSRFYAITNGVKTLKSITSVIGNDWWSFQVTSPSNFLGVSLGFISQPTPDPVYVANLEGRYVNLNQSLFNGFGGAFPVKNQFGYWDVPGGTISVQMYLDSTVWIPIEGVYEARLVLHDDNNNYYGIQIDVQNEGILFPSDYATTKGELVIKRWLKSPCDNTYYARTQAFSLGNNNAEVPLTWEIFHIVLESSPDIIESTDSTTLGAYIWSWDNYHGKVPLLVATYTKEVSDVVLQVGTDTKYASSYTFENQVTGSKTIIQVPAGATSVKTTIPKGVYYITPNLDLMPSGIFYDGGVAKG